MSNGNFWFTEIRLAMQMAQSTLASLLGYHSITVSKWERGEAWPRAYHDAMLVAFARAAKRCPGIGEVVARALAREGAPYALYVILRAAFDDEHPVAPPVPDIPPPPAPRQQFRVALGTLDERASRAASAFSQPCSCGAGAGAACRGLVAGVHMSRGRAAPISTSGGSDEHQGC